MPSNAFKRQLWLLDTLLRHKRLTFEEIRRLWEYASINDERKSLSLRTFHNHKDALCSMFGISIACSAADGYKYRISNEAPLDNAPYLQWLVNTFNTVETIRQSADLHERIILEEMSDGAQFLQTVEIRISLLQICPVLVNIIIHIISNHILCYQAVKIQIIHRSIKRYKHIRYDSPTAVNNTLLYFRKVFQTVIYHNAIC